MANPGRGIRKPLATPVPDRRRELVGKALDLIEKRLDNDQMNSSLGDLVRLLELSLDWDAGSPEPVVAFWVDSPPEKTDP